MDVDTRERLRHGSTLYMDATPLGLDD
jgi:hypothetical protein